MKKRIEKSCEYCNSTFEVVQSLAGRKYCSRNCSTLATRTVKGTAKICESCGKEFEPMRGTQKYCTRECANKAQTKTYLCACRCCGKEYMPKAADRTTYCSRECMFMDIKAKPKEIKMPVCIICNKEFTGKLNIKFCSDVCRKMYEKINYIKWKSSDEYAKTLRKQRDKYISNPLILNKCNNCGIKFETRRLNQKYCSSECADKARYVSETKREERRRYRARKTNAYVKQVNTNAIYERDKGICKLCNGKIDKQLRAPHPMSLSLDHIIPLSRGGTHEPDNVQIAHFICNSKKGNKIISEQLGMG